MAIRGVVFDAVGTLFRSARAISEVYAEAGRGWGADLSTAEVAKRFTPAFFRHFGRAGPGDAATMTATSEELEELRWRRVVADVFQGVGGEHLFRQLWGHFASGAAWEVFADVEPTWSELRRRGLVLAIGSNYDRRIQSVVRELRPLSDCEHVFHSSAVGHAKPGVGFFRFIESSLGMGRDELLFVGDDLNNDYRGAINAGWNALWLVRSASRSDQESGGSVDVDAERVASLSEVAAWLDRDPVMASSSG